MSQEESHPDQEGRADNRRRRQSRQVAEQGALLSGRPTGLPARTAVTSLPTLIGVTADEHWVIYRGPTYALLLIAIGRRAAPSLLGHGPRRVREAGRPAARARDRPGSRIPVPGHGPGSCGRARAPGGPGSPGPPAPGRPEGTAGRSGWGPCGRITPLLSRPVHLAARLTRTAPRGPRPWQDPRRGRRIRAGAAPAPPRTSRSPGLSPGVPGRLGVGGSSAGPAGRRGPGRAGDGQDSGEGIRGPGRPPPEPGPGQQDARAGHD